jgi:hypothetical protein
MEQTKLTHKIREKLIKLFNFNKNNKQKKNDQITEIISDSHIISIIYRTINLNKNLIYNKRNLIEIKNLSKQLKKGQYF